MKITSRGPLSGPRRHGNPPPAFSHMMALTWRRLCCDRGDERPDRGRVGDGRAGVVGQLLVVQHRQDLRGAPGDVRRLAAPVPRTSAQGSVSGPDAGPVPFPSSSSVSRCTGHSTAEAAVMAWASGYASSVFTMASDDTQLGRAVRSDSPSSLTAVGRAYRTPITIA